MRALQWKLLKLAPSSKPRVVLPAKGSVHLLETESVDLPASLLQARRSSVELRSPGTDGRHTHAEELTGNTSEQALSTH
jgi:hypothetical protein